MKEDFTVLKELVKAGKIKPVIDRRYPLRRLPSRTGMLKTATKKEK